MGTDELAHLSDQLSQPVWKSLGTKIVTGGPKDQSQFLFLIGRNMFIHEEKLIVNCFLLLLNICLLTFPTSCLKKKNLFQLFVEK